uniref:Uncharacterized protein n=1 Tax=Anguilla anguilla TaxID=7936 RepID=A0A0E9PDS5_ANGAN
MMIYYGSPSLELMPSDCFASFPLTAQLPWKACSGERDGYHGTLLRLFSRV